MLGVNGHCDNSANNRLNTGQEFKAFVSSVMNHNQQLVYRWGDLFI